MEIISIYVILCITLIGNEFVIGINYQYDIIEKKQDNVDRNNHSHCKLWSSISKKDCLDELYTNHTIIAKTT